FISSALTSTPLSTLSLHDALPIYSYSHEAHHMFDLTTEALLTLAEACRLVPPGRTGKRTHLSTLLRRITSGVKAPTGQIVRLERSEEHSSELQSRFDLVCRLLLEK